MAGTTERLEVLAVSWRSRCVLSPPVGMRATETAVRSDPDERMPQRGAYGVG
jgi:hypothetical protein